MKKDILVASPYLQGQSVKTSHSEPLKKGLPSMIHLPKLQTQEASAMFWHLKNGWRMEEEKGGNAI